MLRKLDHFGDNETRAESKTKLGGFLTVLIPVAALSYLGFLIWYNTAKLDPERKTVVSSSAGILFNITFNCETTECVITSGYGPSPAGALCEANGANQGCIAFALNQSVVYPVCYSDDPIDGVRIAIRTVKDLNGTILTNSSAAKAMGHTYHTQSVLVNSHGLRVFEIPEHERLPVGISIGAENDFHVGTLMQGQFATPRLRVRETDLKIEADLEEARLKRLHAQQATQQQGTQQQGTQQQGTQQQGTQQQGTQQGTQQQQQASRQPVASVITTTGTKQTFTTTGAAGASADKQVVVNNPTNPTSQAVANVVVNRDKLFGDSFGFTISSGVYKIPMYNGSHTITYSAYRKNNNPWRFRDNKEYTETYYTFVNPVITQPENFEGSCTAIAGQRFTQQWVPGQIVRQAHLGMAGVYVTTDEFKTSIYVTILAQLGGFISVLLESCAILLIVYRFFFHKESKIGENFRTTMIDWHDRMVAAGYDPKPMQPPATPTAVALARTGQLKTRGPAPGNSRSMSSEYPPLDADSGSGSGSLDSYTEYY